MAKAFNIAEIAPTLSELKQLPLAEQANLLLARLAVLYSQMQNTGGLHKGNLLLPNDPYGLAAGYAVAENVDVRRYLLGAPWTALVNQGYLLDPAGNGFYDVSEEGRKALDEVDNDKKLKAPNGTGKSRSFRLDRIGYDLASTQMTMRSPRTAIVFNVLIASPSDVGKERDVVTNAIHAWNAAHCSTTGIMLNPIRWETHSFPESGDRPQAIVNRQMADHGDFLIGIFGVRLGTPTGEAQSGTIEEIERFRKAGKHVALYFSTANVPRNANRDELESLEEYRRERQKDTLYSTFNSPEELKERVTQHIPHIVAEVHKRLLQSNQLDGLEEETRETLQHSEQLLQLLVNHKPVGELEAAERRIAGAFDETKPLVPEYGENIPTYAYQTWFIRPRLSLLLRLDRAFDTRVREKMQESFHGIVPGSFYPPSVKANSHMVRWQARLSGGVGRYLTYVRYIEITQEGALRYCEKIDRHDNRQESVSDLFIAGLQFWNFVSDFFDEHNYAGSLSVLQRIDCTADVQLLGTFPGEDGTYYHPNAIVFPDAQPYGVATSSSRMSKEIVFFKTQEARTEIVAEFMLAHLRELCGANVDYEQLRKVIRALPPRAPIPPY